MLPVHRRVETAAQHDTSVEVHVRKQTQAHKGVFYWRWTAVAPVCQLFGVPWGVSAV